MSLIHLSIAVRNPIGSILADDRCESFPDSSDSSDNEFAVCEGGVPIDVWPVRGNHSPASQS